MNNTLTCVYVKEYTDRRGFVVHPLSRPDDKGNSPGKKPLITEWQKLPRTPQDIETYIENGCNMGLVCGKASGVTIIDMDHMLFADDLFNGFDVETLRSERTKGRGHVYFKYNPNLPASKHHDLGIEILSDGSNAVLPPSIHKSGDVYKWNDQNAPIIEMSKELERRLLKLFQIEAELKQIIAKCRNCFKTIPKRHDVINWHGADGREFMIAVCADLKANGANEDHIKMFAKLMYEREYDERRTLTEWRNIDASKTWRCDTLRAKLPAYVDCENCKRRDHTEAKQDSQAGALIKYVESDDVELFHDETHNPYASILSGGHIIILSVKERGFRRWATQKYYQDTGTAPGSDAIISALNVIEAKACFDGKEHTLHNRICQHNNAIWYDLGNWETVKITPQGWEVVKNPPILFKKHKHQKANDAVLIPDCTNEGTKKVLNFVNIKDEKERLLFMVYLVSCFIPDIPHVIPVLHGEKGAAKSTLFKIVKELVDPSTLRLATFPKDNTELVQKLSHHHFIGFDNVSKLSDWQSDALCRACTGEGFSKRELYTDDEDIIYSFQLCVGLNGINVVATKPDLLDRSILLKLERIPKSLRKTEDELWEAFDKVKSEIMSGIFTTISKAMVIRPSIKLDELPRMADFTNWGCAIAEALGYGKDAFLEAYYANIQAQNREAIEGSPVGELILKFMDDKTEWEGSASELLALLEGIAEANKVNIKARGFPKAANSLTRRLNEIKTNLMDEGIVFDVMKAKNGKYRKLILQRIPGNAYHTSIPTVKEPNVNTDDTCIYQKSIFPGISSNQNQEGETCLDGMDGLDGISRTFLGGEVEQSGKEWERLKGQVINSSNLTEFCLWHCEQAGKGGDPSGILAIAEKIFKITPNTSFVRFGIKTASLSDLHQPPIIEPDVSLECFGIKTASLPDLHQPPVTEPGVQPLEITENTVQTVIPSKPQAGDSAKVDDTVKMNRHTYRHTVQPYLPQPPVIEPDVSLPELPGNTSNTSIPTIIEPDVSLEHSGIKTSSLPDMHKHPHLSYFCAHSYHKKCEGFECCCDCHVYAKEVVVS